MQKRKRKKKKSNMLYINLLIFAVISSFLYKNGIESPKVYTVLAIIVMIALPVVYHALKKEMKNYRYLMSPMSRVDKMSGTQFEEYLQANLSSNGYRVQHTGKTGDFGADLILRKGNKKIALQAKRYNSNVGVKAVQEIISAKQYYGCQRAVVATNSHFTKAAKELAMTCNVELWDREKLQQMFR